MTWIQTVRRLLWRPLLRWRTDLSSLTQRLRQHLAETLGESLATLVQAFLSDSNDQMDRFECGYAHSNQETHNPSNRANQDWGLARFDEPSHQEAVDADADRSWHTDASEDAVQTASNDRSSRWRSTVAALCQSVAWWIQQPMEKPPVVFVAGAGVVAMIAVLAGIPLSHAITLAASTFGLIGLADAVTF